MAAAPVKVAGVAPVAPAFVVVGAVAGVPVAVVPVAGVPVAGVPVARAVAVLLLPLVLLWPTKAAALYAARFLALPLTSLMTMAMPFWQWLVWPQ
jgi:hypothetical protein